MGLCDRRDRRDIFDGIGLVRDCVRPRKIVAGALGLVMPNVFAEKHVECNDIIPQSL